MLVKKEEEVSSDFPTPISTIETFFQLLCYLLIFGRFLFHQKESRNLVIILKFQLNGFFGECDIWAIFKSQIILQSFKNLIFWQLMLSVQIHWGDRSKWNDWWVSKHDDYCLENQFLLFLYLSHKKGGKEKWNVNFQSFFLISSKKVSFKRILVCHKCPLEDQETWFGLFCSIIISLANFIPHCPLKITLHCISQFNQVSFCQLRFNTKTFFIEWLGLQHEWFHYLQKCQLQPHWSFSHCIQ